MPHKCAKYKIVPYYSFLYYLKMNHLKTSTVYSKLSLLHECLQNNK